MTPVGIRMTTLPPLIVHVVFRFGIGGLENGVVNLINRMPRRRWRHAVVALTEVSTEFAQRIDRPDVRCIALGKRGGHLVRDYPRLYRLFKELEPAVVHTRNLAALEAVVPAWAAGVPVRIHGEHGWDMQDPGGKRRRYRHVRQVYRPFVNRYVALSHHLEDYLEQQVGIPSERISQIYNGVDTECFRPSREGRPAIPGCPFAEPGLWLVGTVGRMEAIKDPVNLARAFVRAQALDPSAARRLRLILVGDGALRAEARQVLERAGIQDRVVVRGRTGRRPRNHARTRLFRPAIAGRGCFQHDSGGNGQRPSRCRDPGRREFRADRIRDDRNARSTGQQRRARARDPRLLQRPNDGPSSRQSGVSSRRGAIQPCADGCATT